MCAGDSLYTPPLEKFLARLTDEARPPIPAYNIAVVLAHPTEIVGCAAILRRLRGPHVVVTTDGVPPNGNGAAHDGDPEPDKVTARWSQLIAALAVVGQKPNAVMGLALHEGEAAGQIVAIEGRLAGLFAAYGTAIALTHTHEDEDSDGIATLSAVHHAAGLCRRRGQEVTVIEMSFHGAEEKASLAAKDANENLMLTLSAEERALKAGMLACFAPRSEELTAFGIDGERFHIASADDFGELPSGSRVFHERSPLTV